MHEGKKPGPILIHKLVRSQTAQFPDGRGTTNTEIHIDINGCLLISLALSRGRTTERRCLVLQDWPRLGNQKQRPRASLAGQFRDPL